jgi:hypothetical protein
LPAASLVLYGVFRWIGSVRFRHPRSALRGLVISVAAMAAFALTLVSLLGAWGGYVMFLVAALAAVAASATADVRAALTVLGGMARRRRPGHHRGVAAITVPGPARGVLFPPERQEFIRERSRRLAREPRKRSLGGTVRYLLGREDPA